MSGNTRVNLRKILGWQEDMAAWTKQGNRPRIGAGRGVAWMDGHGENGKLPDEADEEKTEKEKEKRFAKNFKEGDEEIKTGDEVQAIENLKDCESGRCVNVRLNGVALAPDGWDGVCRPPVENGHQPSCLIVAFLSDTYKGTTQKFVITDPSQNAAAAARMAAFLTSGYKISRDYPDSWEGWDGYPEFVFEYPHEADRILTISGRINQFWHFCQSDKNFTGLNHNIDLQTIWQRMENIWPRDRKTIGHKIVGISGVINASHPDYADALADAQAQNQPQWPEETCSEMVAGAGGFVAACSGADPHLPSQYATPNRQMTLCDKDGYKVRFTQTDKGWEVWQERFGKTMLIDAHSFKAMRP